MRVQRRLTIDQIAERLALSRSTVYYWVKDIPIPHMTEGRKAVLPRLRKGNLRMQEKYRRLRQDAYAQGRSEFASLAERPTFRDFVSLYLAEGSKRCRNRVSICNSDVAVLAVAVDWMERLTGATFEFRLQYHADQDLDELRRYWADQLDIEEEQVLLQRKSNSNQMTGRTWRSRYGVLTVTVNDTLFRARLEGWMDSIREQWLDSAAVGV
jgi:excisionase family DNA binding protein